MGVPVDHVKDSLERKLADAKAAGDTERVAALTVALERAGDDAAPGETVRGQRTAKG